MNPFTLAHSIGAGRTVRVMVAAGSVLALSVSLAAQDVSPIGPTGTVAPQGTVDQEYAGANAVIVGTMDGLRHVLHFTKGILVHGAAGGGALQGLRAGTTVAVRYIADGGDGSALEIDGVGNDRLPVVEGTVIRIDHRRAQVVIRFDSKDTETFQLTDDAATASRRDLNRSPNGAVRVTVSYTDEEGHAVTNFFSGT